MGHPLIARLPFFESSNFKDEMTPYKAMQHIMLLNWFSHHFFIKLVITKVEIIPPFHGYSI